MTDLQKAKIVRNASILKFLDDNKTIFEKDVELKHFYKKFMSDHAQSMVSAEDVDEDETAFNSAKLLAKKDVCETAQLLCATAKSAFLSWGDKGLSKKTKVGYLHFFRNNDIYTEERLKELHKLLHNHIKSLSPEHITEDKLNELKNKIKIFAETKGSSSISDRPPTDLNARLKTDLKILETDVCYVYKYAEKYKKTNESFYEGLTARNTLLEKDEETDTIVEFTITDMGGKRVLQNVSAKLSKSSEKIESSKDGKIIYNNSKAGRGVATFLLSGYKECVTIVKIKAGTLNQFTVSLEEE